MTEHAAAAEGHSHHVSSPISVGWVIAAALLCAVGLTVLWWAVMYFSWPYFVIGPFFVLAGVLMLLDRRAGLDHA